MATEKQLSTSGTISAAELAIEQRSVVRNGALAAAVCFVVLALLVLLLPSRAPLPTEPIKQIHFSFIANIFLAFWVMFGVRLVSRTRFQSRQDNRGSAYTAPSAAIAVPKAFLQNTLEQAVVAGLGNFALAAVGTPAALSYIVGATMLFSAGRVAFLWKYPRGAGGRAFGMVMTVVPSLGALGWGSIDAAMKVFAVAR